MAEEKFEISLRKNKPISNGGGFGGRQLKKSTLLTPPSTSRATISTQHGPEGLGRLQHDFHLFLRSNTVSTLAPFKQTSPSWILIFHLLWGVIFDVRHQSLYVCFGGFPFLLFLLVLMNGCSDAYNLSLAFLESTLRFSTLEWLIWHRQTFESNAWSDQ